MFLYIFNNLSIVRILWIKQKIFKRNYRQILFLFYFMIEKLIVEGGDNNNSDNYNKYLKVFVKIYFDLVVLEVGLRY